MRNTKSKYFVNKNCDFCFNIIFLMEFSCKYLFVQMTTISTDDF